MITLSIFDKSGDNIDSVLEKNTKAVQPNLVSAHK